MSTNVRAWIENFLDPTVVTSATQSSQRTGYPASNCYDDKRYKPWRSAGYWLIEAGDNTIVFREAVGVDLTATVAAAAYTTTASFLAAVKAALEAAGVATYTVTQDTTTGKIRILSALDGGATVFQLMWTNIASADMAGILGFDTASDDTGSAFYVADDLRIHTQEFLTWDLGIPTNPKAFAAIGARNRQLKITSSAVIKLQGCSTSNFAAPEFEQVVPYFDYVLALENADGLHTVGLRYWRLYIEDVSNPNDYVELGEVFLGDYTLLARGCAVYPFTSSLGDRSEQVVSEGGQVYSSRNAMTQKIQIQWNGLTKADLEYIEDVFNQFGFHKPLFISFDANEAFSTDFETWVRFVRFDNDMEFQLVSPNNFTASWNLKEEL
jgi:hypothetical protein